MAPRPVNTPGGGPVTPNPNGVNKRKASQTGQTSRTRSQYSRIVLADEIIDGSGDHTLQRTPQGTPERPYSGANEFQEDTEMNQDGHEYSTSGEGEAHNRREVVVSKLRMVLSLSKRPLELLLDSGKVPSNPEGTLYFLLRGNDIDLSIAVIGGNDEAVLYFGPDDISKAKNIFQKDFDGIPESYNWTKPEFLWKGSNDSLHGIFAYAVSLVLELPLGKFDPETWAYVYDIPKVETAKKFVGPVIFSLLAESWELLVITGKLVRKFCNVVESARYANQIMRESLQQISGTVEMHVSESAKKVQSSLEAETQESINSEVINSLKHLMEGTEGSLMELPDADRMLKNLNQLDHAWRLTANNCQMPRL